MDLIKKNKLITLGCIFAVLYLISLSLAHAGEYHHFIHPASEPAKTKGVATAIALGQHNFNSSTLALQGSFSTGSYDDSSAFSFGLAKRFKASLISGSVAHGDGKTGYGAAIGFKF